MHKKAVVASDSNKQRLKDLNLKIKSRQKLTPQEQEEAIERILDHLGIK
ncbi:MAG: hypothetical protein HYS21_13720 [Deltaproteobacteria bacterium]|nr:hypothetical protein [Deltaproteobacteria bacterium]